MEWNLTQARNRFGEVVQRALSEGPQRIRRRHDAVVVVAAEEYERLTGRRVGFKEFLTEGESFEGLDLTRDSSPLRDLPL